MTLGAIDAVSLPGVHNATSFVGGGHYLDVPRVGVVGWYDGTTLHLARTMTAGAVSVRPLPDDPELSTACADPGAPDAPTPSDGPSGPAIPPDLEKSLRAAVDYAEAQPDLGMDWYSDTMRVFNVAFTGDLDRHRAEIRQRYSGPLCVVRSRYSRAGLQATDDKLLAAARAAGIHVIEGSVGLDVIDLDVVWADNASIASLRRRWSPALRVRTALGSGATGFTARRRHHPLTGKPVR